MNKNLVFRYSPLSKLIHWLTAFLVISMLSVGFFLNDIPEQFKGIAYMLHKSTGITILFIMIVRLTWIILHGKPKLPPFIKPWEQNVSRIVYFSLYLFLFVMPLSGWIMSVAANKIPEYFGMFKAPLPWVGSNKPLAGLMSNAHEIIAWILIVLITVHVLVILKHPIKGNNSILKRMLPSKR